MVKVGFWFDAPVEYSGGLNYIRNLLYALSLVNDGSVRPCVFFASDVADDIVAQFESYAAVVRTKLLQRRSMAWFVHKVLHRVLGSPLIVSALLKSHGIAVLSHVWFDYGGRPPFRIIGWIPDFQYLHLPELFPTLDPVAETTRIQKIIAQSEVVILSSRDALEDFKRISLPQTGQRTAVIPFVSQPRATAAASAMTRESLEEKYGFRGPYFFLPNQFWAHKNHMVVLHAVKLMKERGIEVLVVCTGNTKDYRVRGRASTSYIDGIFDFIEANGLRDNVTILGQIDYDDVLLLMKYALAVLNPSRFEGWSSSVEEAKSMGKPVVLSRIGVHLEQNPEGGRYFDPDDAHGLSLILADAWSAPVDASNDVAAQRARDALHARTLEFGKSYFELVNTVACNAGSSADLGLTREPGNAERVPRQVK